MITGVREDAFTYFIELGPTLDALQRSVTIKYRRAKP
jgi:hypothetical protein